MKTPGSAAVKPSSTVRSASLSHLFSMATPRTLRRVLAVFHSERRSTGGGQRWARVPGIASRQAFWLGVLACQRVPIGPGGPGRRGQDSPPASSADVLQPVMEVRGGDQQGGCMHVHHQRVRTRRNMARQCDAPRTALPRCTAAAAPANQPANQPASQPANQPAQPRLWLAVTTEGTRPQSGGRPGNARYIRGQQAGPARCGCCARDSVRGCAGSYRRSWSRNAARDGIGGGQPRRWPWMALWCRRTWTERWGNHGLLVLVGTSRRPGHGSGHLGWTLFLVVHAGGGRQRLVRPCPLRIPTPSRAPANQNPPLPAPAQQF